MPLFFYYFERLISRPTILRTNTITHPIKNNVKQKANNQAPIPVFGTLRPTLIKAPITPTRIA